MMDKPPTAEPGKARTPSVKIGNSTECSKAISDAVAKRAYEIYERSGRQPGSDRKNWFLAEREIIKPLNCGLLKSEEGVTVSICRSSLSAKDIDVCAEPHRLIVMARNDSNSMIGPTAVYRVLPLADEIEPSSLKLRAHGRLLEIKLSKASANKKAFLAKAA